jgi:maleate isomerase
MSEAAAGCLSLVLPPRNENHVVHFSDCRTMTRRIGLLIPSSNTSVEPEFYCALPPEITLHTARLYLSRISEASIAGMLTELETQARLLATADVDVIMLGAVAPGFLRGLGYDRELAARIAVATGKRALTTATALLESLHHLKVSRIAIGAPYDKVVSEIASRFLQANDIEVVGAQALGITENLEVGRLPAESAYEMGLKLDSAKAQAIVFAGTNWRTMAITARLEAKIGKPVVSTTAAALWSALRMVGWQGALAGQGQLLDNV